MSAHAVAPKPASAGTQWLVAKGYKNQLRRNYLLQLVDDSAQEYAAQTALEKAAFAATRYANWREHGILPVRIFSILLQNWLQAGHILGYQGQASRDAHQHAARSQFKLDLGFTYAGLQALGAHTQLLDLCKRLAPAFSEGADLRAARCLGDSGLSDPAYWHSRYRKQASHVVLIAHAAAANADAAWLALESHIEAQFMHADTGTLGKPAPILQAEWIEQSCILSDATPSAIHFGMTDSISAPEFTGLLTTKGLSKTPLLKPHALGELLLGHERDDRSNAWLWPTAQPQASANVEPRPYPERKAYADFFKNASFAALRKMQQNVDAFENYLTQQVALVPENWPESYKRAWLKAKMLGRWANGEPVQNDNDGPIAMRLTAKQTERMQPAVKAAIIKNDFVYKEDRLGLGCPIGAHVRRMNPRDDPVVPFLRRPLLRRGVAYGASDANEKGLLGLFFCASLEEQFEHLLGKWSNDSPMGMPQSPSENDPLIGVHDGPKPQFSIPTAKGTVTLQNLPDFVQTLGTLYALFPSVDALQKIAEGKLASYTVFVAA